MPRKKTFTPAEEARIAEIAAKLNEAGTPDGASARSTLQSWMHGIGISFRRDNYRYESPWPLFHGDRVMTEAAIRRGYGRFACKTHELLHCQICACPSCGAPGGCNCKSRDLKDAHSNPRLLQHRDGARRVGLELEVKLRDHDHLQSLFEAWPYCSDDGSLYGTAAEMKFISYSDRIVVLAGDLRRVLTTGGIHADEECGFHVHVERSPEAESHYDMTAEAWKAMEKGLIDRYIAIQPELRSLFPSRMSATYCRTINPQELVDRYSRWDNAQRRDGGYACVVDHYAALSYSQHHKTWEFRLHPGTSSWLLAACWTDWCSAFVDNRPAEFGSHYMAARRAAKLATNGKTCYPWAWRRMLESRARKSGIGRMFRALAGNEFEVFEDASTLREAAKEARVSIWADATRIEVTPEHPEVSADNDAQEGAA